MIREGEKQCPVCGGYLRKYDKVKRLVRTKNRETREILVQRWQCKNCNKLHRELPDYIIPYMRYEAELIQGVIEGIITPDILGYEDYPCELTMRTWKNSQKLQVLLWKKYVF